MYWEYSLYAVPVILITGVVAWIYLRWKGRAEKTSYYALIFGTITAILIAMLVPVVARALHQTAGFSITGSVIAAFILCALVLSLCFFLVYVAGKRKLARVAESSDLEKPFQEAGSESAVGREDVEAPSDKTESTGMAEAVMVEAAEITNETGSDETGSDVDIQEAVNGLLVAAMDHKIQGNFPEAVTCYLNVLHFLQEKDLITPVIIDLCGLAKKINNPQIIHEVLNSEQGKMMDFEIKTEILNNI